VDSNDVFSQTLTRQFIARKILTKYPKFSYEIVRLITDQLIEEIISTLVTGQNVDLKNFGSFSVRSKQARPGRNLRTNEYTEVSARRVVTFKASKIMRLAVQSDKAPTELHPIKSRPRLAHPSATRKNLARAT
jgi:nucleoid DNA-binding protein